MKKIIMWIIGFIICFGGGLGGTFVYDKYIKEDTTVPAYTQVNFEEVNSLTPGIKKIYNAVVVIETYDKKGSLVGTGSGFVYKNKDDKGYIITNNHVIAGAAEIKVINMLEESYSAILLGKDDYLDIAVLSVDSAFILDVAVLGSSVDMNIGDTVFTVGSPLGSKYMGTVTRGIISGKDRKVTVTATSGKNIMEVLQTDAAINPGNSGGPLVNILGEVIGVNSLKLVQDEIEGMGFAIPIELVIDSLELLEIGETVVRPVLGVEIINYSTQLSTRYQIDDYSNGVLITKLEDNYPAISSGLKVGDLIVSIEDYEIEDITYLRYILYKYKVGDTVKIKYVRENKTYETNLKLDKSM